MIRSVVWIVFTSIAFTQCLPPKNKVPLLKLNSVKTNLVNEKLFGGVQSSNKSLDDIKFNIKNINSNYLYEEKIFGEREYGDQYVGFIYEYNEFDNEQDVEVIASYPNTGLGKFIVNYAEVYVFHYGSDVNVEISQGGISQQEVGIKITAKKTTYFGTYVFFYGVYPNEVLFQSSLLNNNIPPLNLIQSMNTNLANEKLSGGYKKYTFGKRVNNDGLIGWFDEYNTFQNDRDVELNVGYPKSGIGKFTVTYVEVYVYQYGSGESAEISQGGINQQEIEIKVTAEKTPYIITYVDIYGIKK